MFGASVALCYGAGKGDVMKERFERHRQPWRADELHKLKTLAGKGMALKAIAKALTRSEESVKQRAKEDGLRIAKLR
jgi:hypothetical protein